MVGRAVDGARYFEEWWSAASGRSCLLLPLADGGLRCFPPVAWATNIFGDRECTTRAASYWSTCGDPPEYVVEPTDRQVCPRTYAVRKVGTPREPVYVQGGGTCQRAVAQPGVAYRANRRAESTPPHSRGSTTRPRRRRTGCVADTPSQPGAPASWNRTWFDSARGEDCAPVRFAEGRLRCAPAADPLETFHATSSCNRPLLRADSLACPSRYAYEWKTGLCPERPAFYVVGARHAGPVFIEEEVMNTVGSSLECRAYRPDELEAFYAVSPLPEEDLAEMEILPP